MFDLAGKTALVTGAGQSVGAGIAQALAVQGASVLVNDVIEERAQSIVDEINADSGTAMPLVFDVTDRAAVIDALHLHGGRRVTKAAAWDLKRVTCRWKGAGRGRRGESQRRLRTSAERSDEARRRLARRSGEGDRREGRWRRKG